MIPKPIRRVASRLLPLVCLPIALFACSDDNGSSPPLLDCDANDPVADGGEAGKIYTFMGTGHDGFVRDMNQRLSARMSQPCDMAFEPDGTMYVVDWNNHMIRHVLADGRVQTVVGSVPPFPGDGPDNFHDEYNDIAGEIPARYCRLNHPTELSRLPDGRFVITAWHNHKLRIFDPVAATEYVACGRGPGFAGDGAAHSEPSLRLGFPNQAELGPDGHMYILDQYNQRIRRIRDFMTDPDGIIETVAGTGVAGYNGDGLAPLATQFNFDNSSNPRISGGMVIGDDGVIYVSDTANHVVRAIDLEADVVTILAGTPGSYGSAGDGGLGTSAQLNWPLDLAFGPDGALYFADEDNHAVRRYDFVSGTLTTAAGSLGKTSSVDCDTPTSEMIGDGKPATEAFLRSPRGVEFGPDGRLYIADTFHQRIRVMTLEGM